MSRFQRYAVNYYLTDYPKGASFNDVLELVDNESEEVTIWEPFEDYPADIVAEFIQHMAFAVKNLCEG